MTRWAVLAAVVVVAGSACAPRPECLSDRDCGEDNACIRGTCESLGRDCVDDSSCTAPDVCNAGTCLRPGRCLIQEQCRNDEECVGGLCLPVRCAEDTCPPGSTCNAASGACELAPCQEDTDCPPPLVCDPALRSCRAVGQVPFPERCDGVDNDLDGELDEGFGVGDSCAVGVGECRRDGVLVCAIDEVASVCDADAGSPAVELCDRLDNDCDWSVDEDFPALDTTCIAGLGICAPGIYVCAADGAATQCAPTGADPSPETCNSLDDDCDGEVDEDYPDLAFPCIAGLGACRTIGLVVCAADASSSTCDAPVPPPEPEACDGIDNDCNGFVDDGLTGCSPP